MNLVERVKNILLQPKPTWQTIDAESTDVGTLYTRYLMILAAIPAVCAFIGLSLIGFGGFGATFRIPVLTGLINMVVSYGMSLVGVYLLGLIINALAPTFGGQKNEIQALKVAVYASTAALVGGIFNLLPALAMLGLLASLYSIYLLYTGLPVLMRSAPDKSVAYTAVVIVAAIVLGVVMAAVSALFLPSGMSMMGGGRHMMGGADQPAITLSTPGGKVTIDAAGLEAASKRMEEAARQMEQAQSSQDAGAAAAAAGNAMAAAASAMGGGQAVPAQSLKAALPEQLAGLPRTGFDVQDGAALGLPTSQVSAQYGTGDRQVRIEIVDMGGLGQVAAMAMGLGQGEKEDQTSAEKTWHEGGRTLHQRYEKDGSHAEFRTVLRNGLVVTIEGDQRKVQDLRGMLAQVDLNALEALPRKGKS